MKKHLLPDAFVRNDSKHLKCNYFFNSSKQHICKENNSNTQCGVTVDGTTQITWPPNREKNIWQGSPTFLLHFFICCFVCTYILWHIYGGQRIASKAFFSLSIMWGQVNNLGGKCLNPQNHLPSPEKNPWYKVPSMHRKNFLQQNNNCFWKNIIDIKSNRENSKLSLLKHKVKTPTFNIYSH